MIVVGSLESNDCLITLKESKTQNIEVKSVVYDAFGSQIEAVIMACLKKENITNISVLCEDKGALDYTIEARLLTAIKRYKEGVR